jgi:hypothetical protein
MQQFNVWESPRPEGCWRFLGLRELIDEPGTICTSTVDSSPNAAVPELSRSRTRIRRRRRKRVWSILSISLLPYASSMASYGFAAVVNEEDHDGICYSNFYQTIL